MLLIRRARTGRPASVVSPATPHPPRLTTGNRAARFRRRLRYRRRVCVSMRSRHRTVGPYHDPSMSCEAQTQPLARPRRRRRRKMRGSLAAQGNPPALDTGCAGRLEDRRHQPLEPTHGGRLGLQLRNRQIRRGEADAAHHVPLRGRLRRHHEIQDQSSTDCSVGAGPPILATATATMLCHGSCPILPARLWSVAAGFDVDGAHGNGRHPPGRRRLRERVGRRLSGRALDRLLVGCGPAAMIPARTMPSPPRGKRPVPAGSARRPERSERSLEFGLRRSGLRSFARLASHSPGGGHQFLGGPPESAWSGDSRGPLRIANVSPGCWKTRASAAVWMKALGTRGRLGQA